MNISGHFSKHKFQYITILICVILLIISVAFVLNSKNNKFEKLSNSVLMLNIYNGNNELTATGSGFVVLDDDILVTNYHVIDKAAKIEAQDENDVLHSIKNVIAFDEDKDLALLRFDGSSHIKPLQLSDSNKVNKGDEVIAIGSPLGLKNTVSTGIVSSLREDGTKNVIQITAPISSGSSGGALLTTKGKVIGVTYAGFEDGQNLNLAIPSNYVSELYQSQSEEQSVEDFFYDKNPVEKYRLKCTDVYISDIFDNPGKYHRKDICVEGYISSLTDSGGYIVEYVGDISNDGDYDYEHNHKESDRIISFSKTTFSGKVVEGLKVGDYIRIYGVLSDHQLNSLGLNFYWRSIEPRIIEIR